MTGDESTGEGASLTRRQVLAATSGSALVGLAGCSGDDSCPDVEHDLNTGYDQSSDSAIMWSEDDDDWRLLTDPTNSGPVPRPATVAGNIPYFSMDGRIISFSNSGSISNPYAVEEFVYEYCFCLHPEFENPELDLEAQADDEIGALRLNGTSPAYSGTGGHQGSPIEETYTDTGLFEGGVNCLEVVVNDTGGVTSDLQLAGAVTAENGDCDCEPGECAPTLSKDTAGPFEYGEQATYSYQICNDGDGECTGELEVEDDLPDGISFVSASGNWTATASGGVVTATNDSYGGLDPGECLTLELIVQVAPADEFPGDPPDEVENCATLSHDGEQVSEDCVTHDITHDTCRLSLQKDTAGEFHYGQQATYSYEVCNEQEEACDGPLTIDDDLPDGISFVSVSGNWTASVSGGVVEATNSSYGGLAPGECITMEMTVQVANQGSFPGDPPAEVENCATLLQFDEPIAEDCVTHPVTPGVECDLSFEKSTTGEFNYGEQHQAGYVYEVCNEGEEACSGDLDISDPLPDGISGPVQPGSGLTGSVMGGVFEGTVQYSGLAPGECLTRELLVTVEDADAFPGDPPSEVENCAELLEGGATVAEDCVTHPVTSGDDTGDDPCPPVAFDLNSGYDQDTDATLGDGVDDDDWTIVADDSAPGSVPKQATVVNGSDSPGNWPAPFQDSRWVSHDASASDAPGANYEYEYCFCLREGFHDPELSLQIRADNTIADIRLNGTSLAFTGTGGFLNDPIEETYTDPDPFQAGENCLTLALENESGEAGLNVAGTMAAQNADCDCNPCAPTLSKEVAEGFTYGEQASYLFTVCNEGEAECTEPFDLVDDLPDGISFVSAGGAWSGSVSGGEVTVTNDSYGGLAPGDCIEFEMVVDVAPEDEFPSDPPDEVENCAMLLQGGDVADEDCVTHPVTPEDPCPPVAFDLNTGWDQDSGTTLGDGVDDDDWTITVDETDPGSVPKQATVVNGSDIPGNWPAPFADSRWISHAPDASYAPPPNSAFEYEYCFCLREGFHNPELDLQIHADNTITDIRLNGISLPFTGDGGFQGDPIEETYTDPDPFQAGENCLTLVLENELNSAGLNVAGTMAAQNADCDCNPCAPTLSKEVAGEFHYGEQASYLFTVCNEGEAECTEPFDVVDDLPDGISFVEAGGAWSGSVSGGEATVTNDSYGGLAPGDCIEFEMTVEVASQDAFPGDPPHEVENCATLLQGDDVADEDCASHDITVDEDPCPPVAFDLNTGYDQASGTTLAAGDDDDDWDIVADETDSGTVPRPATVANSADSPGGSFADSRWIAHRQNGSGVSSGEVESFTYEYCFCLREGFHDPELFLQVQADDQVADIRLNDASLPFTGDGSFQGDPIQESYDDPDRFQAGRNCLEVVVEDTQGVFAGLNVAGTMAADNADCDCEPGGEPDCQLSVEKSTTGEFHYGQQATYVFELCSDPDLNDGECTGPITIEDDLPDGISFVSVSGNWTATVSGGVVEATNDSYGGLAPGDCLTMEMTVEVAGKDEFPGDPPHQVTNCADLQHNGDAAGSDCVEHTIQ